MDDPLLVEDIAAAVDGVPERRLADALRLAERLRKMPERRAARRAGIERRRADEAAAERSRKRRQLLLVALAIPRSLRLVEPDRYLSNLVVVGEVPVVAPREAAIDVDSIADQALVEARPEGSGRQEAL